MVFDFNLFFFGLISTSSELKIIFLNGNNFLSTFYNNWNHIIKLNIKKIKLNIQRDVYHNILPFMS